MDGPHPPSAPSSHRLGVATGGHGNALPHEELFTRVQRHYDDDTIAELTMIIAWENASSRFNRAFRIPSQGFWKR